MSIIETEDFYLYIPKNLDKDLKSIWMFDVDNTILTSEKGLIISDQNFVLLGNVIETFHRLKHDNIVALVSNQCRWNSAYKKFYILQCMFNFVIQIVAKTDKHRKPLPNLYNLILEHVKINPSEIHYTGDAIGPNDPYPPYQWGSTDLNFAKSINAIFHRPIEIFPHIIPDINDKQELIIMVGNPGSGKTTLAIKFADNADYVIINQDILKTFAKVIREAKIAWSQKKSVIIDATNPSIERRTKLIKEIAESKNSVRIFWCIRNGRPFNKLRSKVVPEIAYIKYSYLFQKPTNEEAKVVIVY